MHILITGGSGFLGSSLARELLKKPLIQIEGRTPAPLSTLFLTDLHKLPDDLAAESRVISFIGDLNDLITSKTLPLNKIDAVIHLSAAVSAECEANLDLGLQSNLQVSLNLLQAIRHQAQRPVFVFPSSVAVFGAPPGHVLPSSISDIDQPTPQSSYGIQKFMVEQLVADFTRKGLIYGRNIRLMTVSIRPGKPNGAASSFLSGMLREPLSGQNSVVPVPPETRVALSSLDKTLEGLLCALESPSSIWGAPIAVNLPALSTTVGEMANALQEVAGKDVANLIQWKVDPQVYAIVSSWPSQFSHLRATLLGLNPDSSIVSLIRAYILRYPQAVSCVIKG
jgi:nucleoside-diphosphate-sugar epimerase